MLTNKHIYIYLIAERSKLYVLLTACKYIQIYDMAHFQCCFHLWRGNMKSTGRHHGGGEAVIPLFPHSFQKVRGPH